MLANLVFISYAARYRVSAVPPGFAEIWVHDETYPYELIGKVTDKRILPGKDAEVASGPMRTIAEWTGNSLTLIKKNSSSGYQVFKVKTPSIAKLLGWSDTGLPIFDTNEGLYLGSEHPKFLSKKDMESDGYASILNNEHFAICQGTLYWMEIDKTGRSRLRSSSGVKGPFINGVPTEMEVTGNGFLVNYGKTGFSEWLDFIDLKGRAHRICHQADTAFAFAPASQKGVWIVSYQRRRRPTGKYPYRTDVYRIVGRSASKVGKRKGEFNAYDLEADGMYGVISDAWEMGAWRLSKVTYSGRELQTIAHAADPYYPLPH